MYIIPKMLIIIYITAFFYFLWQTYAVDMQDSAVDTEEDNPHD